MLHVHVRHLVPHDSGQLRFVLGRHQGPEVDEHLAARQREGVDFLLWNDMELERPGRRLRDRGDQLLAKLTNVDRLRAVVGQHGHLLKDLAGSLQPEGCLLVPGHGRLSRIGKCGSGWLRGGLSRRQQYHRPKGYSYERTAAHRSSFSLSVDASTRLAAWKRCTFCDNREECDPAEKVAGRVANVPEGRGSGLVFGVPAADGDTRARVSGLRLSICRGPGSRRT